METERKPSPDSEQGDHRVGIKCTGGTINFTGALISVDSLSNILWGTYKAQINSDNPTEDKIEQISSCNWSPYKFAGWHIRISSSNWILTPVPLSHTITFRPLLSIVVTLHVHVSLSRSCFNFPYNTNTDYYWNGESKLTKRTVVSAFEVMLIEVGKYFSSCIDHNTITL